MSEKKLVYDSVLDIPWLQGVVEKSEAILATYPDEALPSWYLQYRASLEDL